VFTTNPAEVPLVRPLIEPNERNGLREPGRIMVDKISTVPRHSSVCASVGSTT
jgi:mRNA interferase MazF